MITALTIILGLFYFTGLILTEKLSRLIKQTFHECRNMTRTTDFFPPYKHTP